jgi:ubiquinone/menaquinone biosynthesis C-methylase UbiE
MFDSWAPAYDDSALQPAYAGAHRAVLNWATGLRACTSRIADVGCGTGQLLAEAARTFPQAQLFGVDPSAGMLAVAATRTPSRIRLVQANAERLPFPDCTFDLVTATYSIRHWNNPHAALHQIARILTPQGLVGLADAFPVDRRRTIGWRYRLGAARALPPAVVDALSAARLRLLGVATVCGFGAITDTTIAVAVRPGARGAPGGRPVRWRRGVPG